MTTTNICRLIVLLILGVTLLGSVLTSCSTYKNGNGCGNYSHWESHHQFKNLDLQKVKQSMKGDIFIDLRNALDGEDISVVGFHYYSLGFRYPSSIQKKSLAEPS